MLKVMRRRISSTKQFTTPVLLWTITLTILVLNLKVFGGMLGSFVRTDWTMLWCVYTADNDNTAWSVLGPNKTYQFDRAMEIATGMNAGQ